VSEAFVEQACEVMHNAYEAAALGAGWETQERSRKPWADVPEANKATMRAAVAALLAWQGEDTRLLSRLLFEAQERVEMACDSVEHRTGQRDEWAHRLLAEIKAYRDSRGWSPHGFGGET